jgi:HAD superfamily hydrolase (TIGR01490 family)
MEAAFFDLDKTVIDRASIAAFGRPFMKGGLINRRVVARAAVAQLIYLYFGADEDRLVRVRESMLAMTKGWDRAQVRQIVRQTLLETIEPIMYAEALELMELHRAAGHRVYLVSASPEEIVLPLSDMLGVDGAICSRGEVDEAGRYTGRMAFYAYGPEKAVAMRELAARVGIDLEASSAYSDSATDLPMLEAVGRPVAVNADRALAKVARERGWETRSFTKPVRLRDAHSLATGRPQPPQPGRSRRVGPHRRETENGVAYASRRRRAATSPRLTSRARIKSFFMPASL